MIRPDRLQALFSMVVSIFFAFLFLSFNTLALDVVAVTSAMVAGASLLLAAMPWG